jgi:glutamate 5-kinase
MLGAPVILTSFKHPQPIIRALTREVGTFFDPYKQSIAELRKAKLLTRTKPGRAIKVDEGAYQAIKKRASLLPSGILKVEGNFSRGDCISLKFRKETFAVGLAEYSSAETMKIAQKQSREIEGILGYCPSRVVMKSANIVLKRRD